MPLRDDKPYKKSQPIRQSKAPLGKLLRQEGKIPVEAELGTIVTVIGMYFLVEPDDDNHKGTSDYNNQRHSERSEESLVECIASGKIISPYTNTSMLAVGDRVYFIRENNKGKIIKLQERLSWLSRKAVGKNPKEQVIASNITHLLIFMSTTQPEYNRRLLDRYIVSAEQGLLKPVIIINKIDLQFDDNLITDFDVYKKLEIPIFLISALNSTGFDELIEFLKDKDIVLSGPSGSGKSTFINQLIGSEEQQVMEVSERTSKGQHTTSSVRMMRLPFGSRIIDTPGIREFAIWGILKEELALYFHDFDEFNPDCKYYPCTHTHEPDCAVQNAVEAGLIDYDRYISYMNIYDSMV